MHMPTALPKSNSIPMIMASSPSIYIFIRISADPASMEAFYEKKAYEEFEAKQSKAYNLKKRMHGSMSVLINQLRKN